MGCDEYVARVDGPICCPSQAAEGAKDLMGITCLHSCSSLIISQPILDIDPGSSLGSEVLVDQPVPRLNYCLERGNMSCGIDTKKEASIQMSSTKNQVNEASCETIEEKYVVKASTVTQLDDPEAVTLKCYLPKVQEVSDIECGVGELYLNEVMAWKTESEVCASKNALSSGSNLNVFSNNQQMPLKDISLSFTAGDLLVEGDSNPILSSSNIHTERDAEVSYSSAKFELITGSSKSAGKRNAQSAEPSLVEGHIARGEQRYQTLDNQHHVVTEAEVSVVVTSEVERAVTSEVERAVALDPEHAAGVSAELAVSVLPSPHTMKVDLESSENPVSQGPLTFDGLLEAVHNTIDVENYSYHEDGRGKEAVGAGQLAKVQLIGKQVGLRRSSREKKYDPQESRRRNVGKGSKARGMVALDKSFNFLAAAVRRKRSCSNRESRASSWGSFHCLLKHVAKNDGFVIQRPASAKSDGKTKNIQTSASLLGFKRNVSSGPIRLKVKLGNEEIKTINLVSCPVKSESIASISARNGDNQLRDVEKSIICQVNSQCNHSHTEQGLEPGTSIGNGSRSPAYKEMETPKNLADDRYLNIGTSPDSEVIDEVSNSQSVPRDKIVCQKGTSDHLIGNTGLENVASPVASSVGGRKGIKKYKAPRQGSIGELDRAIFSLNVDGKGGSNVSAVMTNAGLDSAESLLSKRLLISAKVQEAKKVKGPKYKERKKNKSNLIDTMKSDMVTCRKVKFDKWALTNKHPIIDTQLPDQCNKAEDSTILGRHGKFDHAITDTSSGRISEAVYGIPIAPGGVGESNARPHVAWVCCDDCHKWRCIPAILAEVIGGTSCTWTCKDNQDRAFADCSIPQEKSNEEINAELEISDGEDDHDGQGGGNHKGLEHELALPQQASWKLIKSNIFLRRSRKKQTADEIMICHCETPPDGKFGCGDECLNRMVNIECVEGNCPCGDLCLNQQFQKRKYAKLDLFRCGKKGYGLQALEDIAEGKFLIEYVGEVLDLKSYEARQRDYASKGHKHFYFMTLNGSEVIDACAKGNLGRFINHSCEPNCRTEKWIVNGEICIGLFAIRAIKKGEEVTFDYNWVRVFGAAAKKCYCGSAQCRGYIGGDPHNTDAIVQGDSDEEFPEPVVVYEGNEIHASSEAISAVSGTFGVAPGENKDIELPHSTCGSLNLEDKGFRVGDLATASTGEFLKIAKDPESDKMFDCAQANSEAFPLEAVSSVSIEKPDNSSVDKMTLDSSVLSADPTVQDYQPNCAKDEALILKSRPQMQIARSSKHVKSRKFSSNRVVPDALSMYKRSQFVDNKPKESLESSANHDLETVDAKLGELLDSAGGICRRKDASRGYLKLLVLTSASGEGSDGATIQSTRDLSMILDAILKTKSRTVLLDIINKNGLQMLHLMMKKCRGNFNKIPILRKLLKVFEFLAEREILTAEHINGGPSRPGVESFRESILSLTEHQDKKVHQIARNFRDRWIPRQFRKYGRMDWGDRDVECNRGTNYSRSLGLYNCWHERMEKPLVDQNERGKSTVTMDSKGSFPPRTCVDKELLGCCTQTTSSTTSLSKIRKRKSRWDQPAEQVPYVQDRSCGFNSTPEPWLRAGKGNGEESVYTCLKRVRNEEHDMICDDEDAPPPGFSCPAFGAPPNSAVASSNVISISQRYPGPLKCLSEAPPLALPLERYNSNLPVSYGIPLNIVQEFGMPQSATSDCWVIAPGMIFHPFPPLPIHAREHGNMSLQHRVCDGTTSMNGSPVTCQKDPCLAISGDHTVDQNYTHFERAPYSQGGKTPLSSG